MKIKCPETGEIVEADECEHFKAKYPPLIRKVLLAGRSPKKKKEGKPQFGVGSLVNDCTRQSYYRMTEEVILSPEKFWIFNRGHAIHEFIQKPLERHEKEIFKRTEFNGFNIIGFIDAIHDGIIYELKTTANLPVQPQTHHVLQAQGYYSLLSPEERAKISKILIVYASLSDIKTFEIPKRNVLPFLEAKGAILANALNTNHAPAPQRGWWCDFCDFKDICATTAPQNPKQRTLPF